MTCGIYQIVNSVNGKRYVGSSVNIEARWKHHLWRLTRGDHHSVVLQRAWNKYGKDSFNWIVLQECHEDFIHYHEQAEIDLKSEYNIAPTAGISRGHKWTDEQKATHRQSKIDYYAGNPEARIKQSEASKNSHARTWVKDKISKATRQAQADPLVRNKMSACRVEQWENDEYKARMSSMASQNIKRPEHRAALLMASMKPKNLQVFNFRHDIHGERICTQWDLKNEFPELRSSNISSVCSGVKGSHAGWTIKKGPRRGLI